MHVFAELARTEKQAYEKHALEKIALKRLLNQCGVINSCLLSHSSASVLYNIGNTRLEDMSVGGKTALMTGGASGIGLCCVKELLLGGAKVALCDYNAVTGENVLKDLTNEFGRDRVIFIKTDVTKAEELEDAFKQTISTFKGLDIVFCNAGIFNDLNWEREVAVNFNAMIRCTLLALQYMGTNNGGQGGFFCYTASILGLIPMTSIPIYTATKHGIIGLCRSFGQPFHFDRTGVRIVAMCPGMTETSMVTNFHSGLQDIDWTTQANEDLATFQIQKPEKVAADMISLIKVAGHGSVWVSEGECPAYEIVIPHYETMKKK